MSLCLLHGKGSGSSNPRANLIIGRRRAGRSSTVYASAGSAGRTSRFEIESMCHRFVVVGVFLLWDGTWSSAPCRIPLVQILRCEDAHRGGVCGVTILSGDQETKWSQKSDPAER